MITESDANLRLYIKDFLRDFKELLGQGAYFLNTTNLKNRKTILKLGFTKNQIINTLFELEIEDYSKGPIPDEYQDENPANVLWVFGKEINCIEIYIKLKIVTKPSGYEKAFCISFHESEYPMKYPLKINLSE